MNLLLEVIFNLKRINDFFFKRRHNKTNYFEERKNHFIEEREILFEETLFLIGEIEIESVPFKAELTLLMVLVFELIVKFLVPFEILWHCLSTRTEVGSVNDHFQKDLFMLVRYCLLGLLSKIRFLMLS